MPPRTPWGHPDISGTYSNSTVVPLERPANMAGKAELTDAGVAERAKTYRGTLFAKRARARHVFDRCITRSLPGLMMPGFYNHYYEIFQTPDYVAVRMEMIHDVRIIPLDNRPHVGPGLKQWLEDSRGHWDGNTLVVETTNFNDKVTDRGPTFFGVGSEMKLIERFTRTDADSIDYRFTVEAPGTFTRPWTAAIPLWRTDLQVFEYACHEGNDAMPHSLSGARAVESRAAGKQQ
jgi:hypothetical protein